MFTMDLKFKGERNYVQGGDIYNELERLAPLVSAEAYVSNLAFKKFTRNICSMSLEEPAGDSTLIARGEYKTNDEVRRAFWVIEGGQKIVDRYEFDEDLIRNCAKIDPVKKTGEIYQATGFTPIENIIALTKFLNYQILPNVDGKWVFGQLDLANPLRQNSKILIKFKSALGERFSVSQIYLDDIFAGTIKFIVGRP